MKKFITKYTLFAILVLALILRLIALNQSLWLDEAIGALVVKEMSFSEIFTRFPLTDNHPPLYYFTLKVWTSIFGFSEITLRMPSVLLGVATVLFVFKIASLLEKKGTFAIFASLLLATSPLHIYYSQEARMYVPVAFLATGAIYFFLKTFKEGKLKDWLFLTFFYTALVFTDYVPVFLYPVFPLYAFFKKANSLWWRNFLVANIPLVSLGYFWLPIFQIQSERGAWLLQTLPAWRDVAGGATIKQAGLVWTKFVLGRISLVNKVSYYGIIVLSSLPFVYSLFLARKETKKDFINWLWLILPLTLGFLASFAFPAFIYFRFIFVLPAFYLMVARGVTTLKFPAVNLLLSLLILINLTGWAIYISDKTQQREDWRGATAFVEEVAGESDIVLFENPEPFAPYRWYAKGEIDAIGATDSISANEEETKDKVTKALEGKEGVYLFEYLKELADPEGFVSEALETEGFREVGVYDFTGVGHVRYFVKN